MTRPQGSRYAVGLTLKQAEAIEREMAEGANCWKNPTCESQDHPALSTLRRAIKRAKEGSHVA